MYRQRSKTFLGILLVPVLVSTIFSVLIVILINQNNFLLFSIINVFILLSTIIHVWGNIALLYAIKDKDIGIRGAYRQTNKYNVSSALFIVLLVTYISFGGFLLLLIPGIIFFIWFSMPLLILVEENIKGMNALLKSREYVRGKWFGVFGRLLFIFLIYLAILFIVGIVLVIIAVKFKLMYNLLILQIIQQITYAFIGLLLTPLTFSYLFLVYRNLKISKGEIVFIPARKQKIFFGFIGVFGLVVFLKFLWFIFSYSM